MTKATDFTRQVTTYDGTDYQRANLAKLAEYLKKWEPTDNDAFDMEAYAEPLGAYTGDLDPADYCRVTAECGTVACALGHGPAAGIKPKSMDDWHTYGKREFGLAPNQKLWSFIFGDEWSFRDNTAKGAAARIEKVLAGKVTYKEVKDFYGY